MRLENTMNLNELETPCLVLDEIKLQANIGAMQKHLNDCGTVLRPHLKTAKNIEIA